MTYLFPERAAAFTSRADEETMAPVFAGSQWRFDSVGADAGRRIAGLVVDKVKGDRVGKPA
jgi:hypothetical protein